MRTTLTIADDVLDYARETADRERKAVGDVISDLARKGMMPDKSPPVYRNGIRLMPAGKGAGRATLELVNRLRDEFE